ncbi:hypothetical protein [Agromyces ramosus]|uniref:Uncharacterized protein n=1 Tax=Agromyces ramosus TaxID=33879 RepID=A0ABU0RBE9_9MICO|nr:hypothetical protein [Agromyces ramosus]MDQ0894536.1 hypothetical protein [Agromyces ramosus]
MGHPLGRSPETLTNPDDQPDGADAGADPSSEIEDLRRAEQQRRMRDLPPQSGEGTALSDQDAAIRRGEDPLDQHKPGPPRNDPLDPDGHVD